LKLSLDKANERVSQLDKERCDLLRQNTSLQAQLEQYKATLEEMKREAESRGAMNHKVDIPLGFRAGGGERVCWMDGTMVLKKHLCDCLVFQGG